MAALAEVSSASGREFAWQSRHEAGCGRLARVSEAWNRAGVRPVWSVAHVAASACDGLWWQTAQSYGRAVVRVGAATFQRTASCFISPDAGVRGGLVAVGPTNPSGIAPEWQSMHWVGCAIAGTLFAREE